ncbi:MAG: RRXRR domain-containing protein, partial [Acidiferrobacter thiooxydans]|nr:RRXRR domain-containing protein [Gammaproteobacteria bacterium]
MAVFVLDRRKKPLMPCSERRARLLLTRGRARVHRVVPFTIRLVDRCQEDSILQPLRLKMDPGSKETGLALVREPDTVAGATGEIVRTLTVLMLLELRHRGPSIHEALTQRSSHRRFRRGRLRHRPARFDNRTRPEGWLA